MLSSKLVDDSKRLVTVQFFFSFNRRPIDSVAERFKALNLYKGIPQGEKNPTYDASL